MKSYPVEHIKKSRTIEGIATQLADTVTNKNMYPLSKGNGQSVWDEFSERGVSIGWFSKAGDDNDVIEAALNYVKSINGKLISEPNKTYNVTRRISIDLTGVKRLEWDMMGSTINFSNGGNLTLGSKGDTPFKTTTLTTDLLNGKTKFDVADASGVVKGDLVSIQSPVEWVAGIPLVQFYTIGDIEGNTIYVDGLIVGDISERQKTEASKTGSITVSFYKLSHNLTVKNGILTSLNRDDEGTMFKVMGQENYLIENIVVKQPKRSGVYVMYSGTGKIKDCRTIDHGYSEKDQGYNSLPEDPQGLGFGYGFIVANNYLTHFTGCHSFSGWHGFDVSRGQSIAIFDDCVIHKDAFGFSSHEGSWLFQIINCKVIGGSGITSRSAELMIKGCVIRTSFPRCILGNSTQQKLIVKDNVFDVSGNAAANVFWMVGTYPKYCYSTDLPYSEVSGNTFIGMSTQSTLGVKGKLVFSNNTVSVLDSAVVATFITIEATDGILGEFLISNNHFHKTGGQFPLEIKGNTKEVVVNANEFTGTGNLSGTALAYFTGNHTNVIMKDNILTEAPYLFRSTSGLSVFKLIQNNTVINGEILGVNSVSYTTVKNMLNNTYKKHLDPSIVVENSVNNIVLV